MSVEQTPITDSTYQSVLLRLIVDRPRQTSRELLEELRQEHIVSIEMHVKAMSLLREGFLIARGMDARGDVMVDVFYSL